MSGETGDKAEHSNHKAQTDTSGQWFSTSGWQALSWGPPKIIRKHKYLHYINSTIAVKYQRKYFNGWGGVTTTWRTILKGSIIRKDENPWPGFQNWFQDASWGRALYVVWRCLSGLSPELPFPRTRAATIVLCPSLLFPLSKKNVQAINSHTHAQPVNLSSEFLPSAGATKVCKKTGPHMGTGRLGMTSTNSNRKESDTCHPCGFLLLGSCQWVPELRWLNLLLPHLQSIQILQTSSVVNILSFWNTDVTQTTFNQPFSVG